MSKIQAKHDGGKQNTFQYA